MRLLVTGKNGQVGWELQRSLQCLGEVLAVDRSELDLSEPGALPAKLNELAPDVIVNAGAYTAVDQAERDEVLATCVNGEAPGQMAAWAAARQALLLHYSTDYVFDGTKSTPWTEQDPPAPLSAYGRSKLAGESAVLASASDHLILRTSWVFASRGHNFLRTMLRLASEREVLRVVSDQCGAPTSARLIADASAQIIARALVERSAGRFQSGVLHLTASGSTTWHGFATEMVTLARDSGRRVQTREIVPISSRDYPTPAKRPMNSRLDCRAVEQRFAVFLPPWRTGLALCMEELP
jgi:dTDP-4-dehydrorhamnose reductase